MSVRRSVLTQPVEASPLNQVLEDLSHGVEDARVRKMPDDLGISTKKLKFTDLGVLKIGTTRTAFPHKLRVRPFYVSITMRTAGTIWMPADADVHRVWLIADAADRKAHVIVWA